MLDLNANAVSKYFAGTFYDNGTGWEWDPAFKDIGWAVVSAGDYGTMTFDLIGNANWFAAMTIKTFDADHMQLVAKKDPNNCLIYNYIPKDYCDSN